tara:strand:+ start:5034 stop:5744 length:711 start_codon:yes stop_codon:yes gene_type:complete
MSKKIFIDCGAHEASSLEFFLKNFPNAEEYETHSFEINTDFAKYFEKYTAKEQHYFYPKAVWIEDGVINFWKMGEESSTVADYHKGSASSQAPCIDLSSWIKSNFTDEDHIVLKMDVEGAEFSILPKMFKDGTMGMVNQFFAEFHYEKRKNTNIELSLSILENLLFKYGIVPYRWDATGTDPSCDKVELDWRLGRDLEKEDRNSDFGQRWQKIKDYIGFEKYIRGQPIYYTNTKGE